MGVKPFDVMNFGKAALLDPKELGYRDSLEIIKDAEFRQMMTAEAFRRVCLIAWKIHLREPIYMESGVENVALINRYLDNIVLGIRSAGGGNELTDCSGVREKLVNK